MLDFNDIDPLQATATATERDAVRADLLARLESVLFAMFPAGKKRRGKFLIGDALGSPGDSLEVVLEGEKAGLWTDRATGDGGDIFDLIAVVLGANVQTDFPRVLQHAADLVGHVPAVPARASKKAAAAPTTSASTSPSCTDGPRGRHATGAATATRATSGTSRSRRRTTCTRP